MLLGFNPLKNPALIFPHPRVTGLRLHELHRSEYISGQLNCIIDQQIASVCLPDILEVDYRAVATIEDIKVPSSGIFNGIFVLLVINNLLDGCSIQVRAIGTMEDSEVMGSGVYRI